MFDLRVELVRWGARTVDERAIGALPTGSSGGGIAAGVPRRGLSKRRKPSGRGTRVAKRAPSSARSARVSWGGASCGFPIAEPMATGRFVGARPVRCGRSRRRWRESEKRWGVASIGFTHWRRRRRWPTERPAGSFDGRTWRPPEFFPEFAAPSSARASRWRFGLRLRLPTRRASGRSLLLMRSESPCRFWFVTTTSIRRFAS